MLQLSLYNEVTQNIFGRFGKCSRRDPTDDKQVSLPVAGAPLPSPVPSDPKQLLGAGGGEGGLLPD